MRRRSATRGIAWFRGTVGALGASAVMVLMLASPAAADPPTVDTFEITFEDVNPCTGDMHTVSIELTLYQHFHGDRFVEHGVTSVTTTPTGFEGRGTTTLVDNQRVFVFRSLDVLTDESGNRIIASNTFVEDPTTGEVRVVLGDLKCVHAAK